MKKLLFLFLTAAILYSCKNDDTTASFIPKTTHLTGIIGTNDSLNIESVQVYVYDYLIADYEEYSADVAADGTFSIDFELQHPSELTAIAGSPFTFIAVPGDSISVTLSPSRDNAADAEMSYTFSGDHATTNEKLLEYKEDFPIDVQQFYDNQEADGMDKFIAFAKANQKTLATYNSNFLKSIDDPLLEDYLNAQEKFYFPTTKIDFANYREYYSLEAPAVDSDYYDFIKSMPRLKQSDLINSATVQRLVYNLTYHYRALARSTVKDAAMDDNAADVKAIELAASARKKNPLLYDHVLHDIYFKGLTDHNVAVYESTKDQFDSYFTNAAVKKSITDKYESEKKLLDSPELPDGAELLAFNSKEPKEFLNEVIANANGKVVYIDNWATWCGPCKVEFKEASPKLHEAFKDEVEFVYFCHNSERRAYIPSIAEFKIKGKHYFLSEEESAVIGEMIQLEGFPTYTVINKAGEIVLSDYIHRPSYPATTELLTKLTNE